MVFNTARQTTAGECGCEAGCISGESQGIKVLRFWSSRLRREKEAIRDIIWRDIAGTCAPSDAGLLQAGGVVDAKEDSGAVMKNTSTFPSPRPSPLGRGRIVQPSMESERGICATDDRKSQSADDWLFPLPAGEGQGEGKRLLWQSYLASRFPKTAMSSQQHFALLATLGALAGALTCDQDRYRSHRTAGVDRADRALRTVAASVLHRGRRRRAGLCEGTRRRRARRRRTRKARWRT